MSRLLRAPALAALVSALLTAGLTAPCRADNISSTVLERARQLVQQLGDDSFEVREQASKELRQLGLPARDVLREGAKSPDLEVRRRCESLLPAILEADRQARLRAFLADTEGKQDHGLPSWGRFRQVAGNDAAARQLFVDMTRGDTGLLRSEGKDPRQVGEQCSNGCQRLYQRLFGPAGQQQPIAVADLATLFLVAGDPKVQVPLQTRYMMFNLLHQPAARTALTTSPHVPFKKIVLAWMEAQVEDPNALQQVFYMLSQLELKEGIELARKVLHEKKVQGPAVAGALTVLGKLGGKEQVGTLKGYLDDKTLIGNFAFNRARGVTQVRDVALAMLVHVTGQSHQDYGFAFSQNQPGLKFYANFLGFENDDQRNKALARWKTWSDQQK